MFTACLLGSYLETASLSHFTAAVKMQVILSDSLLLPPLTCIKSKTFKFLFIFSILIVNTLFTSPNLRIGLYMRFLPVVSGYNITGSIIIFLQEELDECAIAFFLVILVININVLTIRKLIPISSTYDILDDNFS